MNSFLEFIPIAFLEFEKGIFITLRIAGTSLGIGFVIGLPIAMIRVYTKGITRNLAIAYTEIFRGIPLLVLLFVIYYGLPDVDIVLQPMHAAYIALGLNSSAYQAEYFRGAFQAIDDGQFMAAYSIGMTKRQSIFHIMLPQALRFALPAWSNEAVAIVKYTAVVFVIAVPDLMTRAKLLSGKYYNPIESYLLVAIVYIALVGIMTLIMKFVDKKFEIPGIEIEAER